MLLGRSRIIRLGAKRPLYTPQRPADAVYAVRRGIVKLMREDDGDPGRVVRWVRAGSTLGLEALLDEPYRHRAVALQAVEYCRIPLTVLRAMEGRALVPALLRQCLRNLDQADAFVAMLAHGSAEQRFARLLLELRAMYDGEQCVSLLRSDIGSALGVSAETASRLMAEFARRGLVRRAAGRRLACDVAGLRALAAPP
jgi:CRP-like cAMP-binding protein